MPARYEVDVENGVVFAFYWGRRAQEDDRNLMTAIREDPRIQPHFRTLVDYTQVTGLSTGGGYEQFEKFADLYRTVGAGPCTARVALYVSQRNALYGALRQFQTMVDGDAKRLRVFTDLAEARAWAGLPAA